MPYPSEESLSVWGSAPSCGAEPSSGLVLCGAWVCVCTGEAEAVGLEVDAMVAAVCPEAIPGTGRQAPTVTEASEWRMTARQATSAPAESKDMTWRKASSVTEPSDVPPLPAPEMIPVTGRPVRELIAVVIPRSAWTCPARSNGAQPSFVSVSKVAGWWMRTTSTGVPPQLTSARREAIFSVVSPLRGLVPAAVVRSALPGLSSDARITTEGLVLPQVLNGELDSLEVTAAELDLPSAGGAGGQDSADGDDDAEQGGLELLGVDVALTAIGLSDPFPAGSMDVTASVGWDQLTTMVEAAKPSAPALSVQAGDLGTADDPGTMIASTKVFGIDASMTIAPAVADDGGLLLTVTSVTIRGTELDVNSTFYGRPVLSYLGLETPEISIGADKLPQGLSLDRVSVTDTGLSLTLSGSDVELANL